MSLPLSAIVAMDKNRLIGAENGLPWHLPADLAHFKNITMNSVMIMGRHTYESIGRPLPGRSSIIVSRSPDYQAAGCYVFRDIEMALQRGEEIALQEQHQPELFVIGGARLFQQLLPRCQRLYLTLIDHAFTGGDTWMPPLGEDWQQLSREDRPADPKNPYPYSFLLLERQGKCSAEDSVI